MILFQVFVNPKLKVVDFNKVTYNEGCESVQGYEAEVPRYMQVEVSGTYNNVLHNLFVLLRSI